MAKSKSKPMTDLSGPAPQAKPKPRRRSSAPKAAKPPVKPTVPPDPLFSVSAPVADGEPAPVPGPAPDSVAAFGPHHHHSALVAAAGMLALLILATVVFELSYAGKTLPGLTADGVNVGGLTPAAAQAKIVAAAKDYATKTLTVTYANADVRVPISGLAPTYSAAAAAHAAALYGRTGNLLARAHQQLRALFGRATVVTVAGFDTDRLSPYLLELTDRLNTPVQNAALSFDGAHAVVTPAATGNRVDVGRLSELIADRLNTTSTAAIAAPVYQLAPDLTTAAVQAVAARADSYLTGPLTLTYSGQTQTISQSTLVSWLQVSSAPTTSLLTDPSLANLTSLPSPPAVLSLSHEAIAAFVANLAQSLDQPAKNATLAMQNNQLAVTAPSQNGVTLDQSAAVSAITASLTKPASARIIALNLTSTPAQVNENNLASLGITGLISEGETYFPGSPADRLINVRAGAARFNDVLLSPGEVFSFGKLLGEVDASTGYVPELVIDGNHEDYQYGGGLCQVSTTAFRAALLAGLPINERVNHSFAISYYTWPYGVPGVDATIYYPQVDLKFTNDTGHYILIQTIMNGVDLKFDFYGTKTKYGVIRGPNFISGSNDPTKASKTVFYRDVYSLAGQVTKTDTFNTSYQPSTNFPIENTFN